jgi:hypothetical protein
LIRRRTHEWPTRSASESIPKNGRPFAGPMAEPSRCEVRSGTEIGNALALLLAVSTLILGAAACGGTQQPLGDSAAAEQRTAVRTQDPEIVADEVGAAMARAGDGAVARAGDARAGARHAVASSEGKTEKEGESKDRTRKVTLKLAGDQGTPFSGECLLGGREEVLEGRVPERHVYKPSGAELKCDIRKEGAGALEVIVTGDGGRSVLLTNAQGGTVRFVLSGGSVSSSTSSISQNQPIESSQRSVSDYSP